MKKKKIMKKIEYQKSLKDKILSKVYNFFLKNFLKKNKFEHDFNNNKILLIDEIYEEFKNKNFICFGTGESVNEVINYKNIEKNVVVSVTYANFYLKKKFNISSDIWIVNLPEVLDYVIDLERKGDFFDYSKTYILIPSIESSAKISYFHPVVQKFLKIHPEAKIVIYHKNEIYNRKDLINKNHLNTRYQPIFCYGNNTLHNTFIPILSYFNFENIFFLGIDLINDKGHFFDEEILYQSLSGKRIFFDSSSAKEEFELLNNFNKKVSSNIFRLTKNGTKLNFYNLFEKNIFD